MPGAETSDTQYVMDDWATKTFLPEPITYRAVFPFTIGETEVAVGTPVRVLSLDLINADANEFTRKYEPSEYGLVPHIRVDADYHPLNRCGRRRGG